LEDDGVKAICEALKTNMSLTAINLQANAIKNDGAIAICEALKLNTSIISISSYLTRLASKQNWNRGCSGN
jgi:hypothetical protein